MAKNILRVKQTLCSLVAAISLSCSDAPPEQKATYQEINGLPLSVTEVHSSQGGLYLVLDYGVGKVLAFASSQDSYPARVQAKALALLQSEITDTDQEKVQLLGHYQKDGLFQVAEMKVQGYEVSFLEENN